MTNSWFLIAISAVYLSLLFVIAHYGDQRARRRGAPRRRPIVYALGFTVYCTSWSIYGTTAQTDATGWFFPPTYVGTIILFVFFAGFLHKIVAASKKHNITSIADFISSRYGKSQGLAVLATSLAVICAAPYIALQLKAVAESFDVISSAGGRGSDIDTGLFVALMMGVFAILFGSRPIASNAPNQGLMLAIAFEAVFKLVALSAVGLFVLFGLFDGFADLWSRAAEADNLPGADASPARYAFTASVVLGVTSMFCLPRQFHVLSVENAHEKDLRFATRLLTAYLLVMGLLIWPITAGARAIMPDAAGAGYHALTLPLFVGEDALAVLVYLGGLSAATSMVIVSTVALGVMVGNEIAVPAFLKRRGLSDDRRGDLSKDLQSIRRWSIAFILALAFAYYRFLGDTEQLASIGLLSMALAAQFAPAIIGGVYWSKGHARGAYAGLIAGFAVWTYTLLIPSFIRIGWIDAALAEAGPFGVSWLSPVSLFGQADIDVTAHGLFWSLVANGAAYVAFSLRARHSPLQRVQAQTFTRLRGGAAQAGDMQSVHIGELRRLVGRFIGIDAADSAFDRFLRAKNKSLSEQKAADAESLAFAERLLAGAVGSASARIVLSGAAQREQLQMRDVVSLADEASKVFRFNRELLQASMDNVATAISVVDQNFRLVAWNKAYEAMFHYPQGFLYEGRHVRDLIRYNAEQGDCGPGAPDEHVAKRLKHLEAGTSYMFQRKRRDGIVLEIQGNPMPGGGFVTSYTDITEYKRAETALTEANETLEKRVHERTRELTEINDALRRAKADAEAANSSKTKFFTAVSHDVLQPLNAARLFASALQQKNADRTLIDMIDRLDASLDSVQELFNEVLDLSKLDAGRVDIHLEDFAIAPLLAELETEFAALAGAKGLSLKVRPSGLAVRSDRQHLRRIVQNFLSNAVRYTDRGRILVGVRRCGTAARIEVWDTGPGIPQSEYRDIFGEFKRLSRQEHSANSGLGLGLAIVDRLSGLLDHPINVKSQLDRGAVFSVTAPLAKSAQRNVQHRAAPEQIQFAGATVLCIDNDQRILDGMSALLAGWSCRAVCAQSLSGAVTQLRRDGARPDLVLADYHLENGETGLAAYQGLKDAFGIDAPCVIISADRTNAVKDRVAGEGLSFLAKPVKAASLRALMARLLQTQREPAL